jgi:hypothetical protein
VLIKQIPIDTATFLYRRAAAFSAPSSAPTLAGAYDRAYLARCFALRPSPRFARTSDNRPPLSELTMILSLISRKSPELFFFT